jgi:hypothetical protein
MDDARKQRQADGVGGDDDDIAATEPVNKSKAQAQWQVSAAS